MVECAAKYNSEFYGDDTRTSRFYTSRFGVYTFRAFVEQLITHGLTDS